METLTIFQIKYSSILSFNNILQWFKNSTEKKTPKQQQQQIHCYIDNP